MFPDKTTYKVMNLHISLCCIHSPGCDTVLHPKNIFNSLWKGPCVNSKGKLVLPLQLCLLYFRRTKEHVRACCPKVHKSLQVYSLMRDYVKKLQFDGMVVLKYVGGQTPGVFPPAPLLHEHKEVDESGQKVSKWTGVMFSYTWVFCYQQLVWIRDTSSLAANHCGHMTSHLEIQSVNRCRCSVMFQHKSCSLTWTSVLNPVLTRQQIVMEEYNDSWNFFF